MLPAHCVHLTWLAGFLFALNHPGPYLIIIGVCKTHPAQVDTDIPWKPMQTAPSNGGCTCVGFFHFRDFLHFDTQWPTLVLIRNATEQRTTRIRLNIHLWPTWSPSSLLKFLAAGKGDPVFFFLYPARSQKKLAVCLNSTLISDIELFFLSVIQKLTAKGRFAVIRNSKVDLKSHPWRHP